MGYQPLPRKAVKQEAQPKDERPPLQGYGDQLEGSTGEASPFPVYYRSPVVPPSDPPQGGSVIARGPRANLGIITSYDEPPRPRVDPDLIGDYYL